MHTSLLMIFGHSGMSLLSPYVLGLAWSPSLLHFCNLLSLCSECPSITTLTLKYKLLVCPRGLGVSVSFALRAAPLLSLVDKMSR